MNANEARKRRHRAEKMAKDWERRLAMAMGKCRRWRRVAARYAKIENDALRAAAGAAQPQAGRRMIAADVDV